MAGTTRSNPPRTRKRVDNETRSPKRTKLKDTTNTLKRAKDGSAFTRCEECNKDVSVALIDMHNCSLDSKLKMSLDSTVVKKAVETKKPAAPRKKAVKSEAKTKKSEPKAKKSKDPNMPKRPQTAFFLFMDDFRKSFKDSHPDNKKISVVAKEGGERWKSMPDEEKQVYLDRAAELKEEYQKAVEKLNSENEIGEEEEEEDDEKAEDKPDSENENNEEDQGEIETGEQDEKVDEQLDTANENEQDKQEESDNGED